MTRSDVFRAGDVLDGYRLLEDFRVVGAGLSEWSFAERGGRIFFIKRFLSPTYPEADAPGSERIKAKKRARCACGSTISDGVRRAPTLRPRQPALPTACEAGPLAAKLRAGCAGSLRSA